MAMGPGGISAPAGEGAGEIQLAARPRALGSSTRGFLLRGARGFKTARREFDDRQRGRAALRRQRLAVAAMRRALYMQREAASPRFVAAIAPVAQVDDGVFRSRRQPVGAAHGEPRLRKIRRRDVEVAQLPLRRDRGAVAGGEREEKREENNAAHGGSQAASAAKAAGPPPIHITKKLRRWVVIGPDRKPAAPRYKFSLLKSGNVRFDMLEKICEILDCQPGDMLEYRPEEAQ